ncbi:MAG: hypothetical protein QN128_07740 [Armatimonadota bacterium]|nr:hypothetical protein [Armatimonadota bacterium]
MQYNGRITAAQHYKRLPADTRVGEEFFGEEGGGLQPQVLAVLDYSIRYGKAVSPARLYTAVELAQQAAVKGRLWHAIEILERAGHHFSNAPHGFKLIPLDAEPVGVELVELPPVKRGAKSWRLTIRIRYADEEGALYWNIHYFSSFNVFVIEPALEMALRRQQQG